MLEGEASYRSATMVHELALVMPVYNEQDCIQDVVKDWAAVLDGLGIDYVMIILNDGSTDGTFQQLATFAGNHRINLVNKINSGHGPTILKGYREALQEAEWVFQCDSDNEIPAQCFPDLWGKRNDFDAVLGCRQRPHQPLQRKIISWIALQTVRFFFGRGVIDVNVPYRLVRSSVLSRIIDKIAEDTFAPNVIISGVLAKRNFRILNFPVSWRPRSTGKVSIVRSKLYKAAILSFRQTLEVSKTI